jgi:tetratricopeptide (TPR) repeat protein
VQQPSVAPSAPQRLPEAPRNTALISLLDTATAQQQQGDYRAAQTTLQRAQRIAPQDPEVYYKLAATHRNLEDYALAEQVALKGVSIVQGRPAELKRFWLLLTEVYSLAGNGQKAKEAQLKAASY